MFDAHLLNPVTLPDNSFKVYTTVPVPPPVLATTHCHQHHALIFVHNKVPVALLARYMGFEYLPMFGGSSIPYNNIEP